ncbi:PilN domain-containing protein [Gorillibacterium sp. sgz5001074]|uniref:PilN domain-containing protein n=1 Tax=Gorillibacterium sp. sgz5001074 TaxID=3446695 RepID=UPI003F661D01
MSLASHNYEPIEINLLQMMPKAEKKPSKIVPILLIGAILLGTISLGGVWYSAKSETKQLTQDIAATDKQIEAMKTQLAQTAPATAADFIAIPTALKANKPAMTTVLDKLSKYMPKDANISSLALESTSSVKLTALFSSTESVISFTQAVNASKDFQLVSMAGLTKVADGKDNSGNPPLAPIQVSFELKLKEPPKGGGA